MNRVKLEGREKCQHSKQRTRCKNAYIYIHIFERCSTNFCFVRNYRSLFTNVCNYLSTAMTQASRTRPALNPSSSTVNNFKKRLVARTTFYISILLPIFFYLFFSYYDILHFSLESKSNLADRNKLTNSFFPRNNTGSVVYHFRRPPPHRHPSPPPRL